MARKTKTVEKQSEVAVEIPTGTSESKGGKAPRRVSTRPKKSSAKAVKKTSKRKAESGPSAAHSGTPTDEQIRLRAYFISERRHRLALPGDASSDWIEANRQLLSEAGSH